MHLFELLAEPVRRRIVEVLASGEHTAGELVGVDRSRVLGRTNRGFESPPRSFATRNSSTSAPKVRFASIDSCGTRSTDSTSQSSTSATSGISASATPIEPTHGAASAARHRGGRKGHRGRPARSERAEVEIVPREELLVGVTRRNRCFSSALTCQAELKQRFEGTPPGRLRRARRYTGANHGRPPVSVFRSAAVRALP